MTFQGSISQMARRLQQPEAGRWQLPADLEQRLGDDIIRLCVGDPDFATPAPIQRALTDSLQRQRTHYSSPEGEQELRQAIASLETRTSPHPCSASQVVIFPGATNALHSVLSCLLDRGDDIVVPDPMYIGYCSLLQSIGCGVRSAPLDQARGFAFNIAQIEAALSPKTRVVLINTPGNPMGNMIDRQQLSALADFCLQRNLWLVSDEVYSMITFDHRHISLRAAAAQLDNVVVVDGLSKSHAMSGWRIGWAVAAQSLVHHLSDYSSATMFGCCQFVQDAATYTLQHNDLHLASMCREYQRRRDFVVEQVATIDGIHCDCPAAGLFVMINVGECCDSGDDFSRALLQQQRVSTVPGSSFGPSTVQYIRVSLAQPLPMLAIAFERIAQFVQCCPRHSNRQQ